MPDVVAKIMHVQRSLVRVETNLRAGEFWKSL
jgi:hypothetical protein